MSLRNNKDLTLSRKAALEENFKTGQNTFYENRMGRNMASTVGFDGHTSVVEFTEKVHELEPRNFGRAGYPCFVRLRWLRVGDRASRISIRSDKDSHMHTVTVVGEPSNASLHYAVMALAMEHVGGALADCIAAEVPLEVFLRLRERKLGALQTFRSCYSAYGEEREGDLEEPMQEALRTIGEVHSPVSERMMRAKTRGLDVRASIDTGIFMFEANMQERGIEPTNEAFFVCCAGQ